MESLDGSRERTAELSRLWPDFVRFEDPAPQNPANGRRALMFRGAYPNVDGELLAQLSLASQLLETMVYEIDAVLDGDRAPTLGPLDLAAIQFEAYRIFADIFPSGSAVWSALRRGLVELAEMFSVQRAYANGERNLLDVSYPDAVVLAQGKTSMTRAINVAIGELAGRPDTAEQIGQSIDHWMVALCLVDDIEDWRKDAEQGQPSYVLAQAATLAGVGARPAGGWSPTDVERIGRCVYFDGVAREVVGFALDLIRQSREAVADLALEEWTAWMDWGTQRVRRIASALPVAPDPREERRMQPALSIALPVKRDRDWWMVARTGLIWLLRQWRLSFPDLSAVQRSATARRTSGTQVTDVLARAILANTLAAADATIAAGQLNVCIERDVQFILSRSRALLDPPDGEQPWTNLTYPLDEIAEIARLLAVTGRRDILQIPIGAILEALLHGGAGKTDPDLVANLLSAGAVINARGSPESINALLDDIQGAQAPTGEWTSRHYHGSLYSTYQCMRAIATFRPGAEDSLRRAEEFVLNHQCVDGGWSAQALIASDALGTASAMLALGAAGAVPDLGARRETAANRALRCLASHARADGSYPLVPFIPLHSEDQLGLHLATSLGSPSITTALVCQAALARDGG